MISLMFVSSWCLQNGSGWAKRGWRITNHVQLGIKWQVLWTTCIQYQYVQITYLVLSTRFFLNLQVQLGYIGVNGVLYFPKMQATFIVMKNYGWMKIERDEKAHQLSKLIHNKTPAIDVDGWCYAFYCFVLFCIFVSLLSCKLCVMTFGVGVLFFCVSMCGSWLWLDGFFNSCELSRSCPFLVMVFRREIKKINMGLKKELSFWQCSGRRKR
jgi:hypothetical protein